MPGKAQQEAQAPDPKQKQKQEEKQEKKIYGRLFNVCQQVEYLSEETIKEALTSAKYKRWAYVLHDKDVDEKGEPVAPHWHIVLDCGDRNTSSVPLERVAKNFKIQPQYVNLIKGGRKGLMDCLRYLLHATAHSGGKYRYSTEAVRANFDFSATLAHGSIIGEVDAWIIKISKGEAMPMDIFRADPIVYAKNKTQLENARRAYVNTITQASHRINFLITGSSGQGKTVAARSLAKMFYPELLPEECYFETGGKGVEFQRYDGQPVVIFDDFRAGGLVQSLGRENVFKLLDPHPGNSALNIKYGDTRITATIIIITTVEPYESFLDGLAGSYVNKEGVRYEAEDTVQSYRRFPVLLQLRAEWILLLLNKGWTTPGADFKSYELVNSIKNNIKLKYRNPPKLSEQQLATYYDAVDKATLSPVVDVVNTTIIPQDRPDQVADPEELARQFVEASNKPEPEPEPVNADYWGVDPFLDLPEPDIDPFFDLPEHE